MRKKVAISKKHIALVIVLAIITAVAVIFTALSLIQKAKCEQKAPYVADNCLDKQIAGTSELCMKDLMGLTKEEAIRKAKEHGFKLGIAVGADDIYLPGGDVGFNGVKILPDFIIELESDRVIKAYTDYGVAVPAH